MRRAVFVLLLSLGLGTSVRSVQAQDAKQLFVEGMELEKKGDYPTALARFRAAAQVKPTPGVRFHEGYCLEMTGKLIAAAAAYEIAEKLAREQDKAEVLSASRARSEPLAARIPTLVFQIEPKDAEIRVDGVVVATPSTKIDPGDHEVAAQAKGHRPKSIRVTVLEGGKTNVIMSLDPAPNASAAPPPSPPSPTASNATTAPTATTTEPPREEPPKRSIVLPVAVTAGAVAFAAGGIVSFLVAGSTQSTAERECPTKPSCDSERSKVRTFDTIALGGFIGAVGLGALAVILWSSGSSSARVSASASSIELAGEF